MIQSPCEFIQYEELGLIGKILGHNHQMHNHQIKYPLETLSRHYISDVIMPDVGFRSSVRNMGRRRTKTSKENKNDITKRPPNAFMLFCRDVRSVVPRKYGLDIPKFIGTLSNLLFVRASDNDLSSILSCNVTFPERKSKPIESIAF